jgi:hypothetical protein
MAGITTKEHLHNLIDELPSESVGLVTLFVEFVLQRRRAESTDPVLQAFLNAPEDDEPLTDEEIAAIEEGKADFARGDAIRWSEYLAQRQGESSATHQKSC